jgi:alanine racemase
MRVRSPCNTNSGSRLLIRPQPTPRRGAQLGWTTVHRNEITIDLGAVRHNAQRVREALDGVELWAVVKANGYGHGARDVGRGALEAGASALCVVTVAEALGLRRDFPEARIIVMCPTDELAEAREARLELVVSGGAEIPNDVPVHLKLDTGMGRWGLAELPEPPANVVGLMSHLATADTDPAFARQQIDRFRAATEPYSHLTRHVANSAAALRLPEARFDAARCGIALYGISPFDTDPAEDGLRPALSWRSRLAQVRLLQPGESTGYRRRFVAERPTWTGIVPVGYADGFRRDMTGTELLVDGELRKAVGTVSMDAVAVELDRELPVGTPVTIVGDGVLIESHAHVAGTIGYEIACGINSDPSRARRVVVD